MVLAALAIAAAHLFYTPLLAPDISGDEAWYTYNAVYALAWGVDTYREWFGPDRTCGIHTPRAQGFLRETFLATGLDQLLEGTLSHEAFLARAPQVEAGGVPMLREQVASPLEILFHRGNLTALTLSATLWLFGESFVSYLVLQILALATATVFVFELGRRFSNAMGGVVAALAWGALTLSQMRGHIVPQPIASALLIVALWTLLGGLSQRRPQRVLVAYVLAGTATFFDIGLRPFLLLLPAASVAVFSLWPGRSRRMALASAAWVLSLCLLACLLFPLRYGKWENDAPLTLGTHLSNSLLGGQPAGTHVKRHQLYPGDGWWLSAAAGPSPAPPLEGRLRRPLSHLVPVSFYRVWSAPWRQALVPFEQELILLFHQSLALSGLLALACFLGYRSQLGFVALGLFLCMAGFTLVNGYLMVEPRRAVPWIALSIPFAGAVAGQAFAALRESRKGLLLTVVWLAVVLAGTRYLGVASIAVVLPTAPPSLLFAILLALRITLLLSACGIWVLVVQPKNWGWARAVVPVVALCTVYGIGQSQSHWREWHVPLGDGIVAHQRIVLPGELRWPGSGVPWLLLDTGTEEGFEVKANGETIWNGKARLLPWQAEGRRYRRTWRGLPLDSRRLQPNTVLRVEVASSDSAGRVLYGDFGRGGDEYYYGPSIDYGGHYRTVWRARWSPIHDPRVRRRNERQGIRYESALEMPGGRRSKTDLSPAPGRQLGTFRILIVVLPPGIGPPGPSLGREEESSAGSGR